jgi:hypothetical protein
MTFFTTDLLDTPPVVAACAILEKRLSMVLARGMTIGTFQPEAQRMGFMGESCLVEGDLAFLDPNVAKARTRHASPRFLGLMTGIDDRLGLLRLIIGNIQQFEGIFDIVNALAQKHKTVIMSCFVDEVLGFLKLDRFLVGVPRFR